MTETREIVVRLQLDYPTGLAPQPIVASDQPLLHKVAEAARLLAISESAVHELIGRGELESVKIGGSRRITRAGIEAYVRHLLGGGGDAAA